MKEGYHNKSQRVRKVQIGPPYLYSKKISGGQLEEGQGVVHHVQWEHHQSYLLHHYQNESIQGRQIQCRKDQLQVSHVEKNMVEQSSTGTATVPNSLSISRTQTIPIALIQAPYKMFQGIQVDIDNKNWCISSLDLDSAASMYQCISSTSKSSISTLSQIYVLRASNPHLQYLNWNSTRYIFFS